MQVSRHRSCVVGRNTHSRHGCDGDKGLGVNDPPRQCGRLVGHIAGDVAAPAECLQGRADGAPRRRHAGYRVTTAALVLGEQQLAARRLLAVLLIMQLRRFTCAGGQQSDHQYRHEQ